MILAAAVPAQSPMLRMYIDERRTADSKLARRWIFGVVVAFCLIQGFAFALVGTYLLQAFVIAPLLVFMLVIWALPEDYLAVPTEFMQRCFISLFVAIIMWPNYLAIAIPGLPWITLLRLAAFPMALCLAVAFSQSADFRGELWKLINATPLIWRLILVFVIIEIITLPLGPVVNQSVGRFILSQVFWIAVYFVAAYYFQKPGRVTRWAIILVILTVLLGFIAIVEVRERHVPWAGHIPSFLKVEDPAVLAILQGGGRRYTNIYRAQTTFSTALGYGEFIAVMFPFVLHFVIRPYRPAIRYLAAFATVFIVYTALLSGSRSATLGALIASMLTIGGWGVLRWRHEKGSLWAAAIVFGYPASGFLVLAATLFIGRLHRAVWGGPETAASTQARTDQWHKGIPLLMKNPVGHGIGSQAEVLQYRLPNGLLVIDSGYLSVLLQFGFIGFLVFYGIMFTSITYAGLYLYKAKKLGDESVFLFPVIVSLITWFTVKGVNAEEGNNPLVFMMCGMITAILYRVRESGLSPVEKAFEPLVTRRLIYNNAALSSGVVGDKW